MFWHVEDHIVPGDPPLERQACSAATFVFSARGSTVDRGLIGSIGRKLAHGGVPKTRQTASAISVGAANLSVWIQITVVRRFLRLWHSSPKGRDKLHQRK
jgi:hypothetical protein